MTAGGSFEIASLASVDMRNLGIWGRQPAKATKHVSVTGIGLVYALYLLVSLGVPVVPCL